MVIQLMVENALQDNNLEKKLVTPSIISNNSQNDKLFRSEEERILIGDHPRSQSHSKQQKQQPLQQQQQQLTNVAVSSKEVEVLSTNEESRQNYQIDDQNESFKTVDEEELVSREGIRSRTNTIGSQNDSLASTSSYAMSTGYDFGARRASKQHGNDSGNVNASNSSPTLAASCTSRNDGQIMAPFKKHTGAKSSEKRRRKYRSRKTAEPDEEVLAELENENLFVEEEGLLDEIALEELTEEERKNYKRRRLNGDDEDEFYEDEEEDEEEMAVLAAAAEAAAEGAEGASASELTGGGIEKRHKCDICGKAFPYMSILESHKRCHTGEKPFSCHFCDKKFAQKATLQVHERTHTGERPYKCKYCDKTFAQYGTKTVHEKSAHLGIRNYKCPKCSKCLSSPSALYTHKKTHGDKSFQCAFCPKQFTLKNYLKLHIKQVHEHSERKHICKFCSKTFAYAGSLQVHVRTHTGERPYTCKFCPKAFASQGNLQSHERTHTGERPYSCRHCGRSFIQKSQLTAHEATHAFGGCAAAGDDGGVDIYDPAYSTTNSSFLVEPNNNNICVVDKHRLAASAIAGESNGVDYSIQINNDRFDGELSVSPPSRLTSIGADSAVGGSSMAADSTMCGKDRKHNEFVCKFCGKRYAYASSLYVHTRLHTGERPFRCNFCDKSFTNQGNMQVHLRVHTGEKPYKCEACSKSYAQKVGLKIHQEQCQIYLNRRGSVMTVASTNDSESSPSASSVADGVDQLANNDRVLIERILCEEKRQLSGSNSHCSTGAMRKFSPRFSDLQPHSHRNSLCAMSTAAEQQHYLESINLGSGTSSAASTAISQLLEMHNQTSNPAAQINFEVLAAQHANHQQLNSNSQQHLLQLHQHLQSTTILTKAASEDNNIYLKEQQQSNRLSYCHTSQPLKSNTMLDNDNNNNNVRFTSARAPVTKSTEEHQQTLCNSSFGNSSTYSDYQHHHQQQQQQETHHSSVETLANVAASMQPMPASNHATPIITTLPSAIDALLQQQRQQQSLANLLLELEQHQQHQQQLQQLSALKALLNLSNVTTELRPQVLPAISSSVQSQPSQPRPQSISASFVSPPQPLLINLSSPSTTSSLTIPQPQQVYLQQQQQQPNYQELLNQQLIQQQLLQQLLQIRELEQQQQHNNSLSIQNLIPMLNENNNIIINDNNNNNGILLNNNNTFENSVVNLAGQNSVAVSAITALPSTSASSELNYEITRQFHSNIQNTSTSLNADVNVVNETGIERNNVLSCSQTVFSLPGAKETKNGIHLVNAAAEALQILSQQQQMTAATPVSS